jgi:hypothetical protein
MRCLILVCAAGWFAAATPALSARQPPAATTPSVLQNITPETLEATPLLVAQQSLLLARSMVLEQRYSDAISPLVTTAEALAYFEQEVGDPLGQDVGYLRQQIRSYANDVETDHEDAVIRIDDWLSQIRQWE